MPRPPKLKVLIVCEKPNAAQCVATALCPDSNPCSAQLELPQFDRPLPTWRFDGVHQGTPASFTITSVKGHLHHMDFEHRAHRHWYDRGIDELLKPELAPAVRELREPLIAEQLVALARHGVDLLILWLDCDPEGEAIALEVLEELCQAHSGHGPCQLPIGWQVKRAKFSSLQQEDIRAALSALEDLDVPLARSVRTREELDLRVGYAYTRILTMLCRTKIPRALDLLNPHASPCSSSSDCGESTLRDTVMSYGPCQSPALFLVCKRNESRLEAANKEPDSMEIMLELDGCSGDISGGGGGSSCTGTLVCSFTCQPVQSNEDFLELKVLHSRWSEPGLELCGQVQVKAKPSTRCRPLPPNLIAVQRRASSELKLSPDEVNDVLEKLYLRGYITYPRSETTMYPAYFDEHAQMEFLRCIARFERRRDSTGFVEHALLLLNGSYASPRRDGIDSGDHEPIRPLSWSQNQRIPLWGVEYQVWDLLVRMTLAAMSADASGFDYEVEVSVQGTSFEFTATGFLADGHVNWLSILSPEGDEKMLPAELSNLSAGPGRFRVQSARMAKSFLKPELTEAELLSLMEDARIGTDASAATHIAMLLSRGYAILHPISRVVEPTPLGRAFILAFLGVGSRKLVDPSTRALTEQRCRRVAAGQDGMSVVEDETRQILRHFHSFAMHADDFCSIIELGLQESYVVSESAAEQARANTQREWHSWSRFHGETANGWVDEEQSGSATEWEPIKLPETSVWTRRVPVTHLRCLERFWDAKQALANSLCMWEAEPSSSSDPSSAGSGPSHAIQTIQQAASVLEHASRQPLEGDQLSHALAYLLRHDERVERTGDGWCSLQQVLSMPSLRGCSEQALWQVVEESVYSTGQPRFQIQDGLIRTTRTRHAPVRQHRATPTGDKREHLQQTSFPLAANCAANDAHVSVAGSGGTMSEAGRPRCVDTCAESARQQRQARTPDLQWTKYKAPDGRLWWWCEDGRSFFESLPGPWKKYQDPKTWSYWWTNESTGEFFFEP
eukprot:TRINITY_DN44229_c0_g1_i1.p1 TRINITY_DN44229_c0_g1~~TRINITY_DN44229_c0_g1_i1.p1  ORF type:complete len:1016 (+),score=142.62 TRINITY_DN44229_c0_g1_i1:158-3205(+)